MSDLRQLLRRAEAAGCEIHVRGSGHYAVRIPAGPLLFTSSTPGDRRGVLNFRAQLRRAGVAV